MITLGPYLKEVFPYPTMTAYKRQKNIKDITIRARVPTKRQREKRFIKGMKKCVGCIICPYVEGKKRNKRRNVHM